MNVNAVNISGNTGVFGSGGMSFIKFVPSSEETKLRMVKEASGGISKDGDTVKVAADRSNLQKMYESKTENGINFLKQGVPKPESTAEAISKAASDKGISTELQDIKLERADAELVKKGAESISKAESGSKVNNLSSYTSYELKELYQDGDITPVQYRKELESRSAAKGLQNEKEDFSLEDSRKENERKENLKTDALKEDRMKNLTEKERETRVKKQEEKQKENRAEKREEDTENIRSDRQEKTEETLMTDRKEDKKELESGVLPDNVEKSGIAVSPQDIEDKNALTPPEKKEEAAAVTRPAEEEERPTITVRISAPEEREEEAAELENITINISALNAESAEGQDRIQAAENDAAQEETDRKAADNKVIVQEV